MTNKKDHCGLVISLPDVEHRTFCKLPIFHFIKITVFHPDTGRKGKQLWSFCRPHFEQFLIEKGNGWFCSYPSGKRADAPVIDYEIQD